MSEEQENQLDELDISKIEIRSEEVQEILGFIPHWIVRSGISLFFVVIVVILIGSYFFKYPDIISSSIVVTTVNPPATIMAHTTGKIQHLFVKDKEQVTKGRYLAILENSVNHRQLTELSGKLDTLEETLNNPELRPDVDFDPGYSLGELQTHYAGFLKVYSDYRDFMELKYHQKKIEALKVQAEEYRMMQIRLASQLDILSEELKLSKQQFDRAEALHKEGILSQNDFDSARSNYLQKKYSFETSKSSQANAKIQAIQLDQTILEHQLRYKEQKTNLEGLLKQSYENLMGQIKQWEQRYVLAAPIDGVVTFTSFWSVNQNVMAGDKVLTVIPTGESRLIGKVVLPVLGSGKVKVGQKVNVKFDNFPFMEYGMVRGIIKSRSLIAADKHYHLEVDFPNDLKTNYGKELEFSQEMQGTADIITEDVRMLERIFKPIKSMLEANKGD